MYFGKESLKTFFPIFLDYFFPVWTAREVDFTKPFQFLDKELDNLYPSQLGQQRRVDKLVKIYTRSGEAKWILIHIERLCRFDFC